MAEPPISQAAPAGPSFPRGLRKLVLACCAAWVLLALVRYLPPLAPQRWPLVPRLLAISLVALGQCALLLAASRRRELAPRLRQSILLLAAAMFLVAISDVLVVLMQLPTNGPALSRVNDVLELVYNLMGLGALCWMPLSPLRRSSFWLVAIDLAIAVGGMGLVLFVTTTLTGLTAATPEEHSRILQYGLITTGNLVALTLILVRGLAQPVPRAVWYLAGTVVLEIGYWVFVQFRLAGLVSDGRPLDVIFAVDQVCYALAGLAFLTAPITPGVPALTPDWMRDLNPLPPLAVVAVGAMVVARVQTGASSGLGISAIGLVVLSLLLTARMMVAARDRWRLVKAEFETEKRMHLDRILAIRRLSGGVAHVFNNLMTIVIGGAEEGLEALPSGSPARESLASVRDAGRRAAELTARLRTYSGEMQAEARQESVCVKELLNTLREDILTTVGARISVKYELEPRICQVRGQAHLIEECVMHLVRNSRAAMPDGGALSIRLQQKEVARDELTSAILPAPPGAYAVLDVQDSGCGMKQEEAVHIFDPFFSSRSLAVSSGLGLAVVHGAIASLRGGVSVDTAPGKGMSIRLFFPIDEAARAHDHAIR